MFAQFCVLCQHNGQRLSNTCMRTYTTRRPPTRISESLSHRSPHADVERWPALAEKVEAHPASQRRTRQTRRSTGEESAPGRTRPAPTRKGTTSGTRSAHIERRKSSLPQPPGRPGGADPRRPGPAGSVGNRSATTSAGSAHPVKYGGVSTVGC